MRSKADTHSEEAEKAVRDIRWATRRQYSALEAVELTRRRRADFHQGQERTMKLLKQAEYMAATGFTFIRQTTFARGWVHIRHNEPCSALDPISTEKIEQLLMELEMTCTIVI